MDWEVYISGDDKILGYLEKSLSGQDPGIERSERGWILTATALNEIDDLDTAQQLAAELITSISGAARLLLGAITPLQLHHLEQIRTDGTRNIVLKVDSAVMRVTSSPVSLIVTAPDGTVLEARHPADDARKWVPAALLDPQVAKALRLRDTEKLNWTALYRIFEVIVAHTGGVPNLVAHGWVSKDQVRRFKHTANSVHASGDEARHGAESTEPPANPMPLGEARGLVDGLLTRWLNALDATAA